MKARGIGYVFHLRRRRSEPDNIPQRLAEGAALRVTDDHPLLETPSNFEAVDASCVVPFRRMEQRAYAAYSLRPRIRKLLPDYLKPVESVTLRRRWRGVLPEYHTPVAAAEIPALVASCEIDHGVPAALGARGGRASRPMRESTSSLRRSFWKS